MTLGRITKRLRALSTRAVTAAACLTLQLLLAVPSSLCGTCGSLDFEYGVRYDQLNWNIAGPTGTPNVLSELTWSDVEIQLIGLRTHVQPNNLFLRFDADYGWILDGSVRDSDYGADNRQIEFSRSMSRSEGEYVADVLAGGGLRFPVGAGWCAIPQAGYSYHTQKLGLTDGEEVLGGSPGPIAGLNSNYHAHWFGPWVGAGLSGALAGFAVDATYEWHWCSYRGIGYWNLRTDMIDDFEHRAIGNGQVASLQIRRRMSGMVAGLRLTYQDWNTEAGRDRTFVLKNTPGGPVDSFIDSPLNAVNWRSLGVVMSASYLF